MACAPSWRAAAGALLGALPWLNPFAGGPSPSVQPWLVTAACGILLWMLAATGPRPARLRLLGPALAIVLWALLSGSGWRPDTVFLAGGLLLMVAGAQVGTDDAITQGVQTGLLLAAVTSALLGLAQYFGLSDALSPWVSRTGAGEAYANLRQPNQFTTLCWIGAAVLLFGMPALPRRAAAMLVLLLVGGSAASVSRTGMVQGLVLTMLAAWWPGPRRRDRLVLCALAAVVYLAAAAALPILLDSLTGAMPARTLWGRLGGGEGCGSRLVLWSNVLHLIALRPLTGWGWGELDFAHFDTLYAGPRFCDILDNAHNLPLHLAVELGVPAAVLLCGLAAWWAWRQRPWAEDRPLRQIAWAVMALILLHSMLEYPLWYGPFQIAFGASLGWLTADAAPVPAPARARVKAAAVALALALLAATGYAAWDYARVSQIYLPPEQRRAAWADDTLAHVRRSWLFSGQARFAELTLATPQQDNAEWMYPLSLDVLHYSPEPRVIERAIESATYLGKFDEAVLLLARYRAAFPKDYEAWRQAQKLPKPPRP